MTKIIVMLLLVMGVSCTTTGCSQEIRSDTGAGGAIDIGIDSEVEDHDDNRLLPPEDEVI